MKLGTRTIAIFGALILATALVIYLLPSPDSGTATQSASPPPANAPAPPSASNASPAPASDAPPAQPQQP